MDFGGLEPEEMLLRQPDPKPNDPWCQSVADPGMPPAVWELAMTCRKAVLLERELNHRLVEKHIRAGKLVTCAPHSHTAH